MAEIRDINNVPKFMADRERILQAVADKVGESLVERIKRTIDQQGYGQWAPLAESTIHKKGSTKAWVDTGDLQKEIVYRILHDGLGKTIQVGIFESEMGFIAACLEFGTNDTGAVTAGGMMHQWKKQHIPARPLFRLTFDLEAENIENFIADELNRQIDGYLF